VGLVGLLGPRVHRIWPEKGGGAAKRGDPGDSFRTRRTRPVREYALVTVEFVPTDSTTDPTHWQDPEAVALMLDDCETWAVVGLTTNTDRTAYSIAALLQQRGKRIVPINPDAASVLGETGYARLADVPFPVDVVDVFRRSEAAGEFADQAVAISARGVWFQLGVVDEAAFARTRAAGVAMVMDTCPAIEWRKR
jgi:predicted CoA-binding protein